MKIARPQAAVPWAPSRHRYALFRLIAYLRLARTQAQSCVRDESRVLAIDRDQSMFEQYTIAVFVWVTVAAFLAAMLSTRVILPLAIAVSIPIAALLFSMGVVVTGVAITPALHAIGLPRGVSNIAPNSWVLLTCVFLPSSYFAISNSWARYPAWLFLGAMVMNGVASIVLFFLRARLRAAEARCVA